ncbi:outer membrane lipoprotein-sorting protein [Acidobacteriia bacterium AH_259_A11_L15]|nr:outer membrane lipoprotein-sorting protein [Acidobacteriia bacterium AH_259_A11_L15]
MRNRGRRFFLVAALGLAVSATAQESVPAPGDKAGEILDRTIQAMGGENFLQVRDITRRGRIYSFNRGELANPGTKFIDYVKFPGREWFELGNKGRIVYLNNQEQGWELDRQGIREMAPELIERFSENNRRDLDYLLRFAYPRGELELYYLGREFVDNRRVHVVEMVYEDNTSVTLLVDARSYLPMRLRYRLRDEVTGEWIQMVDTLGKYITVRGVRTPMQYTRERNGLRTMEVHLKKVEYNTGVADDFFTLTSLEARWEKVK